MASAPPPPDEVRPAQEPPALSPQTRELLNFIRDENRANRDYFTFVSKIAIMGITVLLLLAASAVGFFGLRTIHEIEEQARTATGEEIKRMRGEIRLRVDKEFETPVIKATVNEAARQQTQEVAVPLIQQQVGKITDKLIEQQLRPVQQRISLVGQISESEMRMRMGFRSALDDLNRLLKTTTDPDVVQFVKRTLATASQDFDTRLQQDVKRLGVSATQVLDEYLRQRKQSLPANVQDVVQMIHRDPDLNAVALAFLVFRNLTGASVKMFDVGAVESWCSQNRPKCQPGVGILRLGVTPPR